MNHPRLFSTPLPELLANPAYILQDQGSVYFLAAVLCLFAALVLIRRALAPIMAHFLVGEARYPQLLRAVTAAIAAALAICAALILLAVAAFGG
jgi:hypothetical protein